MMNNWIIILLLLCCCSNNHEQSNSNDVCHNGCKNDNSCGRCCDSYNSNNCNSNEKVFYSMPESSCGCNDDMVKGFNVFSNVGTCGCEEKN